MPKTSGMDAARLGGAHRGRSHARTKRPGVVLVALPPLRRTVGKYGRAPYSRQRVGRLTEDEIVTIRADAGRPLRDLAAAYGVSHETIRRVLRGMDRATPLIEPTEAVAA